MAGKFGVIEVCVCVCVCVYRKQSLMTSSNMLKLLYYVCTILCLYMYYSYHNINLKHMWLLPW